MKIGRYTASALLIIVGALLLIDQLFKTNGLSYLFGWWPVVLIGLGAEYLIVGSKNRDAQKPLRIDVGGVFFALLISAVVVVVTHPSIQAFPFLKHLNLNFDRIGDFASSVGENGHKFEKETVRVPLGPNTDTVSIEIPNGSAMVKTGNVTNVEIAPTVYVDRVNDERAQGIADRSRVEFTEGGTLRIVAKGEEYEVGMFQYKPRINLTVTVPETARLNYSIVTQNGKIEGTQLSLKNEFKGTTTNGSIEISGMNGNVVMETTNGKITAENINGSVDLKTTNGSIRVYGIHGNASLISTNGELVAKQVEGNVKLRSSNGRITVDDAARSIRANTTNSGISASSPAMGGDWELYTTNGKIEVALPMSAGFTVDGKAGNGDVENLFPGLEINGKKIQGRIGDGSHQMKMETSGSISLRPLH